MHNADVTEQGNNVYSVLTAPFDLNAVKDALEQEFPEAEVYIYTSGYNGAKTIHVRSDQADFEGYAASDGSERDSDFLFNGYLGGGTDQAVERAKSMFARIIDTGVTVQYEVYDPEGNAAFEQKPTKR